MSNEAEIEQQIQMKGLNAPRVTPADLDAVIKETCYHRIPGTNITVCLLTLVNGMTVTGINHGSVDPRNYNEEIAHQLSYKEAREQLWVLLGYELATKLKLVKDAQPLLEGDALFHHGEPTTYIGTKVIYAVPMNRLDYNVLRGWEIPADENPEDEGYVVMYADGGTPNVHGFGGYLSWSPKEVFERSYSPLGSTEPKTPPTFVDRMREEYTELTARLEKLLTFFETPLFKGLDMNTQDMMLEQSQHMGNYQHVLGQRLKAVGA